MPEIFSPILQKSLLSSKRITNNSMTIKTFFILTAISSCLFGIALLFMPEQMGIWHGQHTLDKFGKFTAQMLGGALFATGALGWLARATNPSAARKAILQFLLISDFFYSTVNAIGLIQNNGGTPFQWLELGVTTAFAVGAIYFLRKEI